FNPMLPDQYRLHIFYRIFPFSMEAIGYFFCRCHMSRHFGCASLLESWFPSVLAYQRAGELVCWNTGLLVCWHASMLAFRHRYFMSLCDCGLRRCFLIELLVKRS